MKSFLTWTAYIVLWSACLTAGTATAVFERNPLIYQAVVQSKFNPFKADPFAGLDQLYVLVLGCDQDLYYGGKQVVHKFARTDTIQLVRLDFKHKAIGMMQIPRDTVVHVDGFKTRKINGLFLAGGLRPHAPFDLEAAKAATVEGVTQLTGITPDRVIVLDYQAIREMIDEVGGVEVYVPRKMDYDDVRGHLHVHLKPGRQTLNGRTAIGFLRFRKDSDFHRGSRQQEFMIAFKQKVTGPRMRIDDFVRLSNLAIKVVNGGVSSAEFFALGKFAQEVPQSRIKQGMLPVEDGSGTELLPIQDKIAGALEACGLKDSITHTVLHER